MNKKLISMHEFKQKQKIVEAELDTIGCVELKEVFYDRISWTTPKAIQICKGEKFAWVARSVIAEINEGSENEPSSMFVFSWVDVNFSLPIKAVNRE